MKPEVLAASLQGADNFDDQQASHPGQATQVPRLGAAALLLTKNTTPNPPQEFLHYPAASSLSAAGQHKQPVGAVE